MKAYLWEKRKVIQFKMKITIKISIKGIKIIHEKGFVSYLFISIHSRNGVSASTSKQDSFSNRNKELLQRLCERCERNARPNHCTERIFFQEIGNDVFFPSPEVALTSPILVFSLEKNWIDKREACTYVLTKFEDTCARCYFSCVYMQTPNSCQQWW